MNMVALTNKSPQIKQDDFWLTLMIWIIKSLLKDFDLTRMILEPLVGIIILDILIGLKIIEIKFKTFKKRVYKISDLWYNKLKW